MDPSRGMTAPICHGRCAVSQTEKTSGSKTGPSSNPTRLYIILAIVLVVVIVVMAVLLVVKGIPALRGEQEPTAVPRRETAVSPVPTFTPGPTKAPTNTPLPTPSPTAPPPIMANTDTPLFEFLSAGGRPGVDWTGFFGQVTDAGDAPLAGVPIIVWYQDGTPASEVVKTDANGTYEIRLADAPLAGSWSIQVLTDDHRPASRLLTFNTDEDTAAGIQQIQVLWQQIP